MRVESYRDCGGLKAGRVDILNARFTVFCSITGCHLASIGFFGCFRRMLVLNPSIIGSPFLYKPGLSALCNRWLRSGFHVDGRSTFAGSMGSAGSRATVSVLANRLHCTDRMARRWAEARVHGMAADIGVWGCGCCDGMMELQNVRSPLSQHRPGSRKLSHYMASHTSLSLKFPWLFDDCTYFSHSYVAGPSRQLPQPLWT
jgi:hypothetical protein